VPAQWIKYRDKGSRVRSYSAIGNGESVGILIGRGGDAKLSNINLWRGQLQLPPWSADEMLREVEEIETLGTTGDYVKLVGREQTILGVIAVAGGEQWHIQLWGTPELAERERATFETFVKSLRFRK
jgi:hypothetical protein